MASLKKPSLLSAQRRRRWPVWLALLLAIVVLLEIILVCGNSSLFHLIIPLATGLTRPANSDRAGQAVNSLAFSADGSLLAGASADGVVRLWQVDDGSLLQALTTGPRSITSIAFSADEAMLAAASLDGTVYLWQRDGQPLRTLNHDHPVRTLAFSPTGARWSQAIGRAI